MNIVFDFGSVLFDWQPHVFLARMLPERALDTRTAHALVADFFQGCGGDWSEFDRGTLEPEALAQAISLRTGRPAAYADHL